jgi:hypothetical protein
VDAEAVESGWAQSDRSSLVAWSAGAVRSSGVAALLSAVRIITG